MIDIKVSSLEKEEGNMKNEQGHMKQGKETGKREKETSKQTACTPPFELTTRHNKQTLGNKPTNKRPTFFFVLSKKNKFLYLLMVFL